MKLVYVAGPYRADSAWGVEKNVRAAEVAGFELAELGVVPVIPHTMYRYFDGTLDDSFWLKATMDLLMKCDGALFLDGFRDSAGSQVEHARFGGTKFYQHGPWKEAVRAWGES